jgi:hypothetical protein
MTPPLPPPGGPDGEGGFQPPSWEDDLGGKGTPWSSRGESRRVNFHKAASLLAFLHTVRRKPASSLDSPGQVRRKASSVLPPAAAIPPRPERRAG